MTTITTPSGLSYEDLTSGRGDAAVGRGCFVTVHYVGRLADGTTFDSSRDRGEPFGFPLDVGYVIRGWDEGVKGMRVGGVRRLTVPPELGYGAQGIAGLIPPGAVLVFEVELLGVSC